MPILVIDDHEALRAALDAGLVPAAVQAAPLRAALDDQGRLLLETEVDLARGVRKALRDAGAEFRRRRMPGDAAALCCWAEVLPTEVAPEPAPPLGEILFTSEGDAGFLRLSGELLRLGSERQRLGLFVDAGGDRRNLCRVPEPPYFAILRALDPGDPLRAFAPARPGGRVWIELGAAHPMALRLDAEPGELVLIPRSGHDGQPRPWLRVPDGPWVELDAVSDVRLPPANEWTAVEARDRPRLEVELGLVRAPHRAPADLWVIRDRAIEQLETLVRTVPDELVARLRVATVDQPDPLRGGTRTLVVLRARRNAMGPPALELDAEAYTPAAQIPELYMPVGTVIDPPLRPSRLRELLAHDGRVVWLATDEPRGLRGHRFRRESLADDAFAPLDGWVDHLIGAEEQLLEPWVGSTIFRFDPFVSVGVEWAEGAPAKPTPEPKPRRVREPNPSRFDDRDLLVELVDGEGGAADQPSQPNQSIDLAPLDMPRSEAETQLAELEAGFCALDSPLDAPERTALWAEIGNLQASLHRSRDAGLCWSRALWEAELAGRPSHVSLARRWVESECVMLGYPDGGHMLGIVDVVEADLDEQMVRALAAEVIYAECHARASEAEQARCEGSLAQTPPPLGPELLARLQRFFVHHGPLLDLRALWLARSALARLAGDDRLALFQTRDLIMASLRDGVGLARNIPTFIRTHGNDGDAGDLNRLATELVDIRDAYLGTRRNRTTIESTHPEELTHAYVHLVFAWGLARVGRAHAAREELGVATGLLGERLTSDPIHRAAYLTYHARISQALDGLPPGAPLSTAPDGPIAAREALAGIDRFKYNRLVQLSRILDPRQDVDAFEKWSSKDDEPFEGLALLTEPEALAALFDRQLSAMAELGPEPRARALLEQFEYLEALPEALALPRLVAGVRLIATVPLEARPRLLRNALLIAGYYDRGDLISEVLASLADSDAALTEQLPAAYAELLSRGAPVLRRCSFESQLISLLTKLEQRVGADQELDGVVANLHVAGAFASLGDSERVQPAFEAAYALLPELAMPSDYQILLREIAVALSRSNPGLAVTGAQALMTLLPGTSDSMSTNSHFCLAVIHLMEAVVMSLASEDLALSEWSRRWVEEDEHLLHRRIHRDLARSS